MTLELSLGQVVGICGFLVPAVVFVIKAIKTKDWTWMIFGAIFGCAIGAAGWGIGSMVDWRVTSIRTAEVAVEARQQSEQAHFVSMPEDWQQLHVLLNKTPTAPLRRAYVLDFIKDKTEPEISAEAFELMYRRSDCSSRWSHDYCLQWHLWLADNLVPFAQIDAKAAISTIATKDES